MNVTIFHSCRRFLGVLFLPEIGSIFFIVAGKMLCFVFKRKTMLITHWCLVVFEQCLNKVKGFSTSHASLPVRRLGCTSNWGWTEPEQLTQNDQKDIAYHVMSCGTIKLGKLARGMAAAWGWPGYWSVGGEQLHCVSLVYYYYCFCCYFFIIIFPSFFILLNCF